MPLFLLDKCAACSKDLAFNAPRCVRCWVRYCDLRETIPRARKYFGADSDVTLRLTSTLGNNICMDESSSLDDVAEAEKIFSENLRKATRLHGSNHPTTAKLAYQLKSAHKLIAAMRLRNRARRSN